MTEEQLKKMTRQELEKILDEEEKYSERDIIMTSIELGRRDIEAGNYYTTEEVLENIFGKNYMARKSK